MKRLLLGAAVWIALMFFLVLSALPYGGGGSRGLLDFLRAATVLLPLWALAGFIPPGWISRQPLSASRMAVYVLFATLAVLGGTAMSTLAGKGGKERIARDEEASARRRASDAHRYPAFWRNSTNPVAKEQDRSTYAALPSLLNNILLLIKNIKPHPTETSK